MTRRLILAILVLDAPRSFGRTVSAAAILPGIGTLFGKKEENERRQGTTPLRPPPGGIPPGQRGPPVDQFGRPYAFSPRRHLDYELPPPPPPPPNSRSESQLHNLTRTTTQPPVTNDKGKVDNEMELAVEGNRDGEDPPSDSGGIPLLWGSDPHRGPGPYGMMPPPPPPPGWAENPGNMWSPPPYTGGWGVPEQQYRTNTNDAFGGEYLQQQLDDSIARENDFILQIQNLTNALSSVEQREDLHARQLDVLTERVMESEAELAAERNAAVEYNANCTALGRSLALAQDELEDWKARCTDLAKQHQLDEQRLEEMQDVVKERNDEVEQLAMSIEHSRLHRQRDRFISERALKKRRGFFAWLFGIGQQDSDDDEEERLQELAKSTLLRALQTERNNVEELEATVSTLQQNNSAISEMVESRDSLINELNDRVAVFEEDKIVLKAALRQLQKEMKEEAPKTQKLASDLKNSKNEIERLKREVHSLIATHQDEILLLQETVLEKQSAINATESNLTVIGTYVDKLEERLASFAIARREIDAREKKCEEIEKRAFLAEQQRDEMTVQIDDFTKERDDLKVLLEELVQERTKLQGQQTSFAREREELLDGEKRLQATVEALERDIVDLGDVLGEWKSRVRDLEAELEDERNKVQDTQAKLDDFVDARQYDEVSDDTDHADALSETAPQAAEVVDGANMEHFETTSVSVAVATPDTRGETMDADSVDKTRPFAMSDAKRASRSSRMASRVPTLLQRLPFMSGTQVHVDGSPPTTKQEQLQRNVPFRGIRKTLSRYTGIHGLITPPSRKGGNSIVTTSSETNR